MSSTKQASSKHTSEDRLEFWIGKDGDLDICGTIDRDKWLVERVEDCEWLNEQFENYKQETGLPDTNSTALAFASAVGGKGIYGDGEPLSYNTYNGEDLLSDIIQYAYWTDDDGAYVLLEKHYGGDARGNYGPCRAYKLVDDYDGTSIFDNARATIYCDDCGKHWDSDDGSHWYPDGCCGRGYMELQDYPATDERPDYPEKQDPAQLDLPLNLPERPKPCAGVVWVDDERNGYCPYCGGLLHIASRPVS